MQLSTHHPDNIEEIKVLFTKTFSDSEGQSEGILIGTLANDFLTSTDASDFYCFIATENENIIGSIIFSKLTFESEVSAFLLGPVAVHTSYQGKGIGQKLINFGLSTLKENGVELAISYGDPNYYSKVGFRVIDETILKAPLKLTQPEGGLAQSLVSDEIEPIAGNSHCVEAINKPEYW
ncbi:MAG: N-acetyltransferase [Chloroflexi bacterium]|nr:MAG: N-acetyltransferase [Chloroflexota bacterium]MBL1195475.1 N-acetyltransferase [Chloroflexota bacterium]NOH12757.1 N-acetyltransferase [Chloroflexota bacterium]